MALRSLSLAPSSNIVAANYDDDTMELTIMFKSGAYRYSQVPGDVITAFEGSLSAGKFFYAEIRDLFEYERIS